MPLKICDPDSSTIHACCKTIGADGTGIAKSIVQVVENPWTLQISALCGYYPGSPNQPLEPFNVAFLNSLFLGGSVLLFVYSEYKYREPTINASHHRRYAVSASITIKRAASRRPTSPWSKITWNEVSLILEVYVVYMGLCVLADSLLVTR